MPIRVEQRRIDGRMRYRVVGIVWGGTRPVDRLGSASDRAIRGTPFTCARRRAPITPGRCGITGGVRRARLYDIALRAADPAVRTRRLDLSFYIRRVRIDEV